jgi:hypothetical protein
VDPKTCQEDVKKRKILARPGLELRALGRPTSCYIYCAIPAPNNNNNNNNNNSNNFVQILTDSTPKRPITG